MSLICGQHITKVVQMNLFAKQNRDTGIEGKCSDTRGGKGGQDKLGDWD